MGTQTLRILLAEADSNQIAVFLRALFPDETSGGEVTVVSTAATLFPSLSLIRPDVILLDVSLDPRDPLELVRRVRRAAPRVPLLVLAGTAQEDIARQAMAEGMPNYLLRDRMSIQALDHAIRSALAGAAPPATLSRDPLTGLLSRQEFLIQAAQRFDGAMRRGGTLVLLCAELQGMDDVSSGRNSAEFEEALGEACAILSGCFRHSDLVARIGTRQFGVLAVNAAEPSLPLIRQRVERRFAMRNELPGCRYPLRLNLGMRYWTPHAEGSLKELIAATIRQLRSQAPAGRDGETAAVLGSL
jgi:DNA-binding NarL/FixJ family response regulator